MRVALLGHGKVLEAIEAQCRRRGWEIAVHTDQPTGLTTLGQADLAFASRYRHKLSPDHLAVCPVLNVHPSLLPWNRGSCPNVWPLLDGSPAGVSIHWMDAGIDTGPVVLQRAVPVHPTDTAHSLYLALEGVAVELVGELFAVPHFWHLQGTPQALGGPTKRMTDLTALDVDTLDRMTARELWNRLRARSYPPYGLRVGDVNATITLEVCDADS